VFHQYVVRTRERDRLREHLRVAQIGTGIHYPVPVHLQPAYRGRFGEYPAWLPQTTRIAREILSLPIYPQLGGEAAERVIAEIRRFFE
jgi:hypothetical protein